MFRSSVSELERETGSDSGRDHGNRGRKISGERGGGGSSRDNRGGGGGSTVSANNFVQLRGLPFMVKESEIKSFLSGSHVMSERMDGEGVAGVIAQIKELYMANHVRPKKGK